MKFINPTTLTFSGFFISFVAIIVNALVLANINNRIGAADAETARLNAALREQTANGNEAEAKFGEYRMMYHLASLVPTANRSSAADDANVLFNKALTFLFAAANEVSLMEIRRTESEQQLSEENIQRYEAAKEAEEAGEKPAVGETPPTDEAKESEAALDDALRELETPEEAGGSLLKKIEAIDLISNAVAAAKDDNELFVKLFPINQALSARWVQSVKSKQARLAELETEKKRLIKYQGYSTFAALSLQMLGLMFVILKDVLERKEKAAAKKL